MAGSAWMRKMAIEGYTIKLDPNNRFQLPIYFGAGYAAISGSDITKYAGIDFGLRVRLKQEDKPRRRGPCADFPYFLHFPPLHTKPVKTKSVRSRPKAAARSSMPEVGKKTRTKRTLNIGALSMEGPTFRIIIQTIAICNKYVSNNCNTVTNFRIPQI